MIDNITLDKTGLVSDVDIYSLPKGHTPVTNSDYGRMNVMVDKYMRLITMDGNSLVQHYPSTSIILAIGEDKEEDRMLILMNAGGLLRIDAIDYNGNITTEIDEIYIPNATSYNSITELVVIGTGNDKMVAWADANNEPMLIMLNQTLNEYYDAIGYLDARLIRQPPYTLMSISYEYDSDIKVNTIKGKSYQFAQKCIFEDGTESVWSIYTPTLYYPFEYINGYIPDTYNYIEITIYQQTRKHIKSAIAYRYTDTETGTPSSWYLYDTITSSSYPDTVIFVDNKAKDVLSSTEMLRLYDDVPKKADGMSLIKGNILALYNPTKGYNNITVNASLASMYATTDVMNITTVDSATLGSGASTDITLVSTAEMAYFFTIHKSSGITSYEPDVYSYIYTGVEDFSYYIINDVYPNLNHNAFIASITRLGVNSVRITSVGGAPLTVEIRVTIVSLSDKYKTVKFGAKHFMGIQYEYEGGRKGAIQASQSTELEIPYHSYDNAISIGTTTNHTDNNILSGIKFEINHLAPVGALRWQWVYGGSNITQWYELPVICREFNGDPADITTDGFNIIIDVNAADGRILSTTSQYNTLISFDAEIGDYVRIKSKLSYADLLSPIPVSGVGSCMTTYNEYRIIDIGDNGELTIENKSYDSDYVEIIGNGTTNMLIIEVYRVKSETDNIVYREIGQSNAITNRYHQFTSPSINPALTAWYERGRAVPSQTVSSIVRNQDATHPCIGIIDCFDAYNYSFYSNYMTNASVYDELMLVFSQLNTKHASLLYNSKTTWGKVNYIEPDSKERKRVELVHGGSYSEDGIIYNELNVFDSDDVLPLDDKYGYVYGLVEEGNVLNVIQEKKYSSVGVNVSLLTNPDGSEQLTASDSVLNKLNEYVERYGTVFSRSIQKNKSSIYFYDIYNGDVVRRSPNGLRSISGKNDDGSDYLMRKFFKERSKALLESGINNIHCSSGYDIENNLYYLTCIDSSVSANSFTAIFNERDNLWMTFCDFYPHIYFSHNSKLYHIKYDAVDAGNTNGIYLSYGGNKLTFFGETTEAYITIVSNEGMYEKIFESIKLYSNDIWEAYDNTDIVTGEDAIEYEDGSSYNRYTTSMQSRLREDEDKFKWVNGCYEAYFGRNMITNQSTPDIYDLINGEKLRGKYLKIKLKNDNTSDDVNIRAISIVYSPIRGQ